MVTCSFLCDLSYIFLLLKWLFEVYVFNYGHKKYESMWPFRWDRTEKKNTFCLVPKPLVLNKQFHHIVLLLFQSWRNPGWWTKNQILYYLLNCLIFRMQILPCIALLCISFAGFVTSSPTMTRTVLRASTLAILKNKSFGTYTTILTQGPRTGQVKITACFSTLFATDYPSLAFRTHWLWCNKIFIFIKLYMYL